VEVPATTGQDAGQVSLLTPEITSRVPLAGRIKLTVVEPGPRQQEELIAIPAKGTE
jgi:hypothetical protein